MYRQAKPLLARMIVFGQSRSRQSCRRGAKLGVGGGDGSPRCGERTLGLVGKWKTGGVINKWEGEITRGKSTPKLNTAGASVQSVTWLPTVRAKTGVRPTVAFFRGEGTPGTPSTVQIHGGGLGRGGIRTLKEKSVLALEQAHSQS